MGKILRTKAVCERIGLSRTTLWRRVRGGEFPAPLRLGANAVGWREQVVEEWLGGLEAGR